MELNRIEIYCLLTETDTKTFAVIDWCILRADLGGNNYFLLIQFVMIMSPDLTRNGCNSLWGFRADLEG